MGRLRGLMYRVVMRLAHRFNWHYAPPIYIEGDKQLWCKWCGFRETINVRDSNLKFLVMCAKADSKRHPADSAVISGVRSPWA